MLLFASIFIAKLIGLMLFILRYTTDKYNLTNTFGLFYNFANLFVPLLTAIIVFLIAKQLKIKYRKEFAIFIFFIWMIFLTIF